MHNAIRYARIALKRKTPISQHNHPHPKSTWSLNRKKWFEHITYFATQHERGLVERQSCPSDRRARYAALTREGTGLMRRVFPLHADAMREAMDGLTSTEQRAVTALLKRLGLAATAKAAANPACREGLGED